MAEGHASGGSEVAVAFVSITADMDPLKSTLGKLTSLIASPLAHTSDFIKNAIGTMFDVSVGHLIEGNIGKAVEHIGTSLTHSLTHNLKGVLTAVLGETIGGTIGSVVETVVNTVGDRVFGLLGKITGAVFAPIKAALAAPLTDLDLWVNKAIEAEVAITRFEAAIEAAGGKSGWSAEQLEKMAHAFSSLNGASMFSIEQLRATEQGLLMFDRVRGDVFQKALKAAVDLASLRGTDPTGMAHILGMALSAPEHGAQRLRRGAGIFVSEEDMDRIKNAGDLMSQQEKLLEIIAQKGKGASEKMSSSTEAALTRIRHVWEETGKGLGEIFVPITHLLADITEGIVRAFSGTAMPVFKDMKSIVEDWVGSVRGWLNENRATFRQWAGYIEEIGGNVWAAIKAGLRSAFGELDMGKVRSFADTLRDGVTEALGYLSAFNWENMKTAARLAWEWIGLQVDDQLASIKANWSSWAGNAWEGFKTSALATWTWLKTLMVEIVDMISDRFGGKLKLAFAKAFESMPSIYGDSWYSRPTKENFMSEAERKKAEAERKHGLSDQAQKQMDAEQALHDLAIKNILDEQRQKDAAGKKGAAQADSPEEKQRRDRAAQLQKQIDDFNERMENDRKAADARIRDRQKQHAQDEVVGKPNAERPQGDRHPVETLAFNDFYTKVAKITAGEEDTQKKIERNTDKSAKHLEEIARKVGVSLATGAVFA